MIPWEEAQPGDDVGNGYTLIKRRIRRKCDAKSLAHEVCGKVWLDGPRHWAVVTHEQFKLRNDTPKPKPPQVLTAKRTQRVLFCGMDCLPGQQDLFKTDGVSPPEDDNSDF